MADREARIHKLAEGHIRHLCERAGATVQKPEDDQHGWDLMVEFPASDNEELPDLQKPLRRCLIQVKSTTGQRATCALKLSNALKFAKEPLPCFVAMLTYPGGRTLPETVHLKHFWTPMIAEALLRAREAAVGGLRMNRIRLSLSFAEAERADGDFASALIRAVDAVGPGYSDRKHSLASSIGYDDTHSLAELTFAEGVTTEQIDELLLGMRDNLRFSELVFTDQRFGIPGPARAKGAGVISVTSVDQNKPCALSVELAATGEEISWPGEVFAGLPAADASSRRMRIVAGPMELVFHGNGLATARWRYATDRPASLEDLMSAVTVRTWLHQGEIRVSIWSEGRRLFTPHTLRFDAEDAGTWSEVKRALAVLCSVAPPQRRPEGLTLTFDAVLANLDQLSLLAGFVSSKELSVLVELPEEWAADLTGTNHLIVPWVIAVGDYVFISVVEREVTHIEKEKHRICLSTVGGSSSVGLVLKGGVSPDEFAASEADLARARANAKGLKVLSVVPQETGPGMLLLCSSDGDQ